MGDRAIRGSDGLGMGSLHFESVDANSKATEQYTERRVVDGQTVFLSPEGAEKLDSLERGQLSVAVNGTSWDRLKAAIDEFLGR